MAALVDAIDAAIERENPPDVGRSYLGCSQLAKSCERELWYSFHWSDSRRWEPRILRLLGRGNHEEQLMNSHMTKAGVDVYALDEDGNQYAFSAVGGHLRGHCDGFVKNLPDNPEWHLLELKTANEKSFAQTEKNGVKADKPVHWGQMQIYMHLAGDLRYAMYLVVNKNTDALYDERVEYDQIEAERLLRKAERIIASSEPPERVSDDPTDYYHCKYCDYREICHYDASPEANCRTCAHSTPERDGDARWVCEKHQTDLSIEAQRKGCEDHLFIPALLNTWATLLDAGEDWVGYENTKTGAKFANGKDYYTSYEIAACNDVTMLGDQTINELRQTFGGKITG